MKVRLPNTVTYWGSLVADGRGGYTFAAPVACDGRWEDTNEIFINQSAEEETSKAVIFIDRDLDIGGYVALGDQTAYSDPLQVTGAYRIKGFAKIPDIKSNYYVRKAWV